MVSLRRRKRVVLLVAAVLLFSGAVAVRSTAAANQTRRAKGNQKVRTVVMKDFQYQPSTLQVEVGQTVEWKNEDIVPHTATTEDSKSSGAFDSGSIAPGASWRLEVKTRGSFDYLCTLHPNMKARLVVK